MATPRDKLDETLTLLHHLDLTGAVIQDSDRAVGAGGFGDVFSGYFSKGREERKKVAIKYLRVYIYDKGEAELRYVSECNVL